VTARRPTGITLDVDGRTPWGEGIEVFGRVSGSGINGIPVGLERQEWDFTGPFSGVGTPFPVRTDRGGRFRIFVPSLFATTRLRAITHTAVQVISSPVIAPVTVQVGVARRLFRKRARIRGSVRPAAPNGRATLQRRSTTGRWTFVKGSGLRPLGESRSRYTFTVKRSRKRTHRYRVRVIARDGGAHYPGRSRSLRVPKLKKQRR